MPGNSPTAVQPGTTPAEAVASNPFWYHTIEVAEGVETPGWFDLRPIVEQMPWPDVEGKRCLDVGTADGFLAFELERRGASEIVATDLADHELWDWPQHLRDRGVEFITATAGPKKGLGFQIARRLLESKVQSIQVSAYDLSPESVGEFDVIVCGSLLLHLRDPVRALEAIRSVCRGHLLLSNEISPMLSLRPRAPLARFSGAGDLCQWWVPNPAGQRHMLQAAGFKIERDGGIYSVPFGRGHAPRGRRPRSLARAGLIRVLAGRNGVPHYSVLARG
jgi:tRNA (mo5U34)-methyltransferase